MPTFNEYQDNSGYFIRAWTPDTGNINYKIRDEGNPIVEDYGLRHGDDISWDTVTSLKSLGLIFTDESGTIRNEDFNPDPEHVEESSLSDDEARRLLDAIRENEDLTPTELDQLCSILGISSPPSEFQQLEQSLESVIRDFVAQESFPTQLTVDQSETEELDLTVTANDPSEATENGRVGLQIQFFMSESDSDDVTRMGHNIWVCEEHGIENWLTGVDGEKTWLKKAVLCSQKSILLPFVVKALESNDIDPGSPESSPHPVMRDFEDLNFDS